MFQSLSRFLCATVFAVGSLSTVALADAYVFGKPQLGTFPTIQAAVDAADQSDVVIVNIGSYAAGFTLDNKGVTVLGAHPTNVVVNGACEIKNLGPKRRAALINLVVNAQDVSFGTVKAGLRLTSNLGHVWLQGCLFKGGRMQTTWSYSGAGPGIGALDSPKVIVKSCTLLGRDIGFVAGEFMAAGGHGLDSVNSGFAFYDCTIRGGRGSDESNPAGGLGGDGAHVEGWGFYASGTTIRGGNGGGGDYIGCTLAGDGGDALWISGAQAQLLDTTLTAGLGNGFNTCGPGTDGELIVSLDSSVVNFHPGARRLLNGPTRGTDSSFVHCTVAGQPLDQVWLLTAYDPSFRYLSTYTGVAALPWPWLISLVPMGIADPAGQLNISLGIGEFTETAPGRVLYAQGVVLNTSGRLFLTGPMQLLIENQ